MSRCHPKGEARDVSRFLPRLVPTGSVDKILLRSGKNLSLFQCAGVLVFGVSALVLGLVMLRDGELWFALWGSVMSLWGLVALFNGSKGIVRLIRKRDSQAR